MEGIPVEIIEKTIDCLYGDTTALKACSLTCRAWLLRARYNLFDGLVANLQARQLKGLSESSIPFFVVRRLSIAWHDAVALRDPFWTKLSSNIRRLSFDHAVRMSEFVLVDFLSSFQQLEFLSISNCAGLSPHAIMQATQTLSKLLELRISELNWEGTTIDQSERPFRPQTPSLLWHLYLADVIAPAIILDLILEVYPTLELRSCWVDDLPSDMFLIKKSSQTLKTLDLRGHIGWPFDLGSFPNLETVVIPYSSSRLGEEIHEKFFRAIRSPYFKHLVLFPEQDPKPSRADSAGSLVPNPWVHIDEGVAQFRHPVDILIYSMRKPHHDLGPLRAEMEGLLPLCWARGSVHIHLHGDPIWDRLHVYGSEDW